MPPSAEPAGGLSSRLAWGFCLRAPCLGRRACRQGVMFKLLIFVRLNVKEAEIAEVSEQRQRLESQRGLDAKALEDKHKRIAALEKNLLLEKNVTDEAQKTATALQHAAKEHAACRHRLLEREAELSRLKPIAAELQAQVHRYGRQEHVRVLQRLERDLARTREELAVAEDAHATSKSTIEDLEKKVKGKQWVVKSLQEDGLLQRSREAHLLAHIKTLEEKLDTYERKFRGRGIDVPVLIAKLKDYEVRVRHLQGKVRMLTKQTLRDLAPGTPGTSGTPGSSRKEEPRTGRNEEPRHDEDDRMRTVSSDASDHDSLSMAKFDEEEGTFASHTSNDMEEESHAPPSSAPEQGFLGDILSDFKEGIESLQVDLCCAQTSAHRPTSPLGGMHDDMHGGMSPDDTFDSQGLASHSLSRTFAP